MGGENRAIGTAGARGVAQVFAGLSADEALVLGEADRFARAELYPLAAAMDEDESWPAHAFPLIGRNGYFGVTALICVLFALLVLYPLAALAGRGGGAAFARGTFPAQAVAFSARSSLAALPAMMEAARERLRLPEQVTTFFLPLAASTFRIGGALGITTGIVFIAHLYGVALAPAQLATIVLTVVLTTFSVPGIPAGSIIVMVPVLLAAGLPVEGMGILLGVDTIPDMFRTTTNVTGDMVAAAVLSRGEGDGEPRSAPASVA